MEPTNHPFRKENDLPNPHDYIPAVNLQGCSSFIPCRFTNDQTSLLHQRFCQDLMKLHINEKLSDAALGPSCVFFFFFWGGKGVCEEQCPGPRI